MSAHPHSVSAFFCVLIYTASCKESSAAPFSHVHLCHVFGCSWKNPFIFKTSLKQRYALDGKYGNSANCAMLLLKTRITASRLYSLLGHLLHVEQRQSPEALIRSNAIPNLKKSPPFWPPNYHQCILWIHSLTVFLTCHIHEKTMWHWPLSYKGANAHILVARVN